MKMLDVAFLHPPVRLEQKQGLNQMIFIPTGVFSLAAYAQQHGFEPKIFNLGLELATSSAVDLENFVKSIESKIYAIDLHWAVHSGGAIEIAQLCKRYHPGSLFFSEVSPRLGLIKKSYETILL